MLINKKEKGKVKMISIALKNKQNQIVKGKIDHEKPNSDFYIEENEHAVLGIKEYQYQEGDYFEIKTDLNEQYYMVQLEETLAPSLVYIPNGEWRYDILITKEQKKAVVETAFSSKRHHIMVRKAYEFEKKNYQNLTFNAYDQKEFKGAYPHAYANVETRNEAVFFAKNAIDGKYANLSHGSYPFASWGINQQKNAMLTIDFGREVTIDCLQVFFRGDYPHDSYWESIAIEFSDGSIIQSTTTNSLEAQVIRFKAITTTTIALKELKKAVDNSSFPALTQVEAFGINKI